MFAQIPFFRAEHRRDVIDRWSWETRLNVIDHLRASAKPANSVLGADF